MRSWKSLLGGIVLTTALAVGPSDATASGSIVEKSARAEVALATGNGSEAIGLLREALREAWTSAPFSIEKAVFVTGKAEGYGVYFARPEPVFQSNEPLLIYLEPVAFKWLERNGRFESLLTVDLELFGPDGRSIVSSKGFGRLEFSSKAFNTEYMTNLTVRPGGLPPANYVLEIAVIDQFGGSSAQARLPFIIR